MSNLEYVNLAQENKLNEHLKIVNKSETISNISMLKVMVFEIKRASSEYQITHERLHDYIANNLSRLE